MPIQTRYIFTASMDVDPAKEALFNEVYDTEHVPLILKVPGVIAAVRLKKTTLTLLLGGEKKTIVAASQLLAAAALYPALALAVIGTADLLGTIARNAGGLWLALVTGGVLLVVAILLLLGIFLVAPLVLCVGGVALVARLARRRGV